MNKNEELYLVHWHILNKLKHSKKFCCELMQHV